MIAKEKEALKAIVEKEIKNLSIEVESIKKALYPKKGEGPTDKVAHLNFKLDQSIHIQRYEEATKRLNRLKQAVLKIDTPEYGICLECEEPIPLERLKLIPESRYCVECMQENGIK